MQDGKFSIAHSGKSNPVYVNGAKVRDNPRAQTW
jgi:hypothetical protein